MRRHHLDHHRGRRAANLGPLSPLHSRRLCMCAWHGMAWQSTYTIVQQRMCSLTQCCRGTAAALRIDRWGSTLPRCLGCTATLKAVQRAVWRLVQLTELFTVSGVTVLAQDVLLFLFSLSFVFSVGTNLSRVYRELQKRRPIEFRASDCRRMANAPRFIAVTRSAAAVDSPIVAHTVLDYSP